MIENNTTNIYMDLIICFCILFLSILLFWEFSKILLIKTVECIANTGVPAPPPQIKLLQYTDTEISAIQFKINELIEAFNKIQQDLAGPSEEYNEDPNSTETPSVINEVDLSMITGTEEYEYNEEPTSTEPPIKIQLLDLSMITGTENELAAIQPKLNTIIDTLKSKSSHINISHINISNIPDTAKKMNAIMQTLNQIINAFNIYVTELYEEGLEKGTELLNEGGVHSDEANEMNNEADRLNTSILDRG
jgi:hypothetical protein